MQGNSYEVDEMFRPSGHVSGSPSDTVMIDKRAMPGQIITIPAEAKTVYSPDGKILKIFSIRP